MAGAADDEQGPAGPQLTEIIAAASAVLGRPLADPVLLQGGSDRSAVLRCAEPDTGGTVVVKSYPPTAEGRGSFAAEAAGLQLAGGTGLAPDLLAADASQLVVVMSDLGPGGSLAALLLGGPAEAAERTLLDWASSCGRLSASVAGKRAEFDGLHARYLAGQPDESYMAGLRSRILGAGELAALLGIAAPAGLGAELAEVAAAAGPGRYAVFTPGDICPDNNLLTADGLKFLDFESAGFHPAFLDAAYIRMPFSTCWCVFRLPAGLAAGAEAAYRREVSSIWPELAGEEIWQAGVRRAMAAWSLSGRWLLHSALDCDAPLDPEQTSPRRRQLLRYRWQALAAELEAAGELPAVAGLMRALLLATEHWQAEDLPLYPAFRDGGARPG